MTSLNTKLVLSALGIALLASPAFAQRQTYSAHRSQSEVRVPNSNVNAYPNPQSHSGSQEATDSGNNTIGGD